MRFTLVMLGFGLIAAAGVGAVVRCIADGDSFMAIVVALLALYGWSIVLDEARS